MKIIFRVTSIKATRSIEFDNVRSAEAYMEVARRYGWKVEVTIKDDMGEWTLES